MYIIEKQSKSYVSVLQLNVIVLFGFFIPQQSF